MWNSETPFDAHHTNIYRVFLQNIDDTFSGSNVQSPPTQREGTPQGGSEIAYWVTELVHQSKPRSILYLRSKAQRVKGQGRINSSIFLLLTCNLNGICTLSHRPGSPKIKTIDLAFLTRQRFPWQQFHPIMIKLVILWIYKLTYVSNLFKLICMYVS